MGGRGRARRVGACPRTPSSVLFTRVLGGRPAIRRGGGGRQCPLKIQKEKLAGLQFTSTDYMSIVSTPLRIRWTIPLRHQKLEQRRAILLSAQPCVINPVIFMLKHKMKCETSAPIFILTLIWTRVDSESRFAIFLARILWKMLLASRENINASLASLTSLASLASLTSLARRKNAIYFEAFESRNLRDSQTSKIIIHSEKLMLDLKFLQNSQKTPELKFVMILTSLATKFVCETHEKRVLLWNFFLQDSWEVILTTKILSVRLAISESRY